MPEEISKQEGISPVDPATIIDRSTFKEPQLISEGVKRVFVNGQEVWLDGKVTGNRPGKALRRGQ